jgi:PTS system mannose-specific IIB component
VGTVNLARVDQRLIHGQVMMTLSQRPGVNSIFVVDDTVAKDKYMKDLYKSAGSRTGKKTITMTEQKCEYYWDEFDFKNYNCILIAKTVDVFYRLAKHGIKFDKLNIGGTSKQTENDIQVTKAVYLNKKDLLKLKDLNENYGVSEIYFQTTPAAQSTDLSSILKKYDI